MADGLVCLDEGAEFGPDDWDRMRERLADRPDRALRRTDAIRVSPDDVIRDGDRATISRLWREGDYWYIEATSGERWRSPIDARSRYAPTGVWETAWGDE